jgi:PKD repeat protein
MMILVLRVFLLVLSAFSIFVLIACKEDNVTSGDSTRPIINSITPAEAFAGQTNVRAVIVGSNFTGLGSVNMGAGIDILKTKLISNTEVAVRFTVRSDADSGPRTISVSTLGGVGQLEGVFSVAENRSPQASFSANPPGGGKGVEIIFDASASEDGDGTIQLFQWDFGDGGEAEGKVVTYRYERPGTFTVTLTVTDNRQSKTSSTRQIKIENTIPPVAHINIYPQEGNTDTLFEFNGSTSGDHDGRIQSFVWEFGDGSTANGPRVTHKFSQKGDFFVRLTVTDNDGLEGTREKAVRVIGRPPIASFTITPSTGTTDTVFQFDSTESVDLDGDIEEVRWIIENNTFTNRIPLYSFTTVGTFEIMLTVTDDDGEVDTLIKTLHVSSSDDNPPPDDGDDDPPSDGGRCTVPAKGRDYHLFEVISEDREAKIVTGRFLEPVTCSDVFYLCGDVRRGGIDDVDKGYWIGVICEMYDLGNNTFRIHLRDGKDWVEVGETNTYVWPQFDCNPDVVCR